VAGRVGRGDYRDVSGLVCGARRAEDRRLWGRYRGVDGDCVCGRGVSAAEVYGAEEVWAVGRVDGCGGMGGGRGGHNVDI